MTAFDIASDLHDSLARLRTDYVDLYMLHRDDPALPVGHRIQLRVLARDVSLSLVAQPASSIVNQVEAVVEAIADDTHPSQVLVRLRTRTGTSALLARVTRRSAQALALAPGLPVWAMVKSVALLD